MLIVCLGFVAAGLWMAPREPLIGYSSAAFFGLGVVIAIVTLHPNSTYLLLDKSGFTFSTLFRKSYVPWHHVQSFVVARVYVNNMVGWNYSPNFQRSPTMRRVNTRISGAEAALPDTYGLSAGELVAMMNNLRAQYGSTAL